MTSNQPLPDLDQSFRRIAKRLFFPFQKNPDGFSLLSVFGLLVILFLVWVASGFFMVEPAERAVVLQLGRYKETLGPGFHWIPRGIEKQNRVNILRVYDFHYQNTVLTQDENMVSLEVIVHYRTEDPMAYLFTLVDPESTIRQAVASTVRQVVGRTSLEDIMATGRGAARDQILSQLQTVLKNYQAGVTILDVTLQPARPPEEVNGAFDNTGKAKEERQRIINEAQAYAMRVKPLSEGEAAKMLQEAEAYKQQVVLEATAETADFLALLPEYSRSPDATKKRLYYESMETVLSRVSKIMLGNSGPGGNTVYLPLDKMLQNLPDTPSEKPFMPSFEPESKVVLPKPSPIHQREGYGDGRS